jgi:polyphosphate kinase
MSQLGKSKSLTKELAGFEPEELLHEITDIVRQQQQDGQRIHDELVMRLGEEDIAIVDEKGLTSSQKEFVRKFFIEKVSPSVFTLMINDLHKLPELKDKSTYLAIKIATKKDPDHPRYALIEVPAELIGRFIELPKYGKRYIMYLEDLIRYNLNYIFFIFDFDEIEAHIVKITRDAELDMDNDLSKSFIEKMTKSLRHRRTGDPVRLIYDREISSDLLQYLVERMDLDSFDSLIAGGRYHNKKDYIRFPNVGGPELENPVLPPLHHPDLDLDRSLLDVISKKDVMLFLPYHTFSYYIRLLREAALDPRVKRIGITLYRLASKSRIISALINAAKNGKEVTVVIELQARFDEENNIRWTKELRQEGVQVIFGVRGLKVHSKVTLISRLENGRIKEYAAIGTGNLNESTSRIYTDYHLLTSNRKITKELNMLFDFFDSNYLMQKYEHLIISPHYTRERFCELIDREIQNAKNGMKAAIWIKMNSLSDLDMIDKLYEASQYGVKIKLIIRGICSLIPGKKGLSENIEAISIVDRFLEHTRLFIFENGGERAFYIGSADWMKRNIDARVEVTTPVYSKSVQKELMEHFEICWSDNEKARYHGVAQGNQYKKDASKPVRSQLALFDYHQNKLKKKSG